MPRYVTPLCLSLLLSSVAPAAIVYEPVTSQYRAPSGDSFYYGGSDPRVFALATRLDCARGKGCGYIHPGLIDEPVAVFTDCLPHVNAAVYGYTPTDARNEAYANVPRYFRKGDLLASAPVAPDGTVVVPAQLVPQPLIEIRPSRRVAVPATRPLPLLILPKPGTGKTPAAVATAR